MSDNINELASLQYNLGDLIRQIVAQMFICDYGIVQKVNADKTVDVSHAVQGEYIDGTPVPITVTGSVEVVYPGSSSFAQTWPIAVGDGVLLIGLKDFVKTTKSIQPPKNPPNEFPHYSQDTLKAIPLQNIASPAFQFNVDSSALGQIKNNSKSLFTILNNVDTAIQTFSSTASQSAITAGNATSATLAAAINALLIPLNSSITTAKADLALLLKA